MLVVKTTSALKSQIELTRAGAQYSGSGHKTRDVSKKPRTEVWGKLDAHIRTVRYRMRRAQRCARPYASSYFGCINRSRRLAGLEHLPTVVIRN
jgi:hypothetical protein